MNNCMLCKFNNILLLTFLLILINTACAEEISIVTELLEPYQMRDKHGYLTGYSVEVMQILMQ